MYNEKIFKDSMAPGTCTGKYKMGGGESLKVRPVPQGVPKCTGRKNAIEMAVSRSETIAQRCFSARYIYGTLVDTGRKKVGLLTWQ
jgi:hypothetical protein